jgi:hypothetical protein
MMSTHDKFSGEGGDVAPFPRPLILLEDAKTLLRKRKLCPKKLCHSRGSPQGVGNNLGTSGAENRPKPAIKATLRHDETTR